MLLLASEAISAIANGPVKRRDRVRALVAEMNGRNLPVATVAAVLAEVIRGRSSDAAVLGAIRRQRIQVHPVDQPVAVRAGQILGGTGSSPDMTVDAFLVADADVWGGALIATCDRGDMERLAAVTHGVMVADVDA